MNNNTGYFGDYKKDKDIQGRECDTYTRLRESLDKSGAGCISETYTFPNGDMLTISLMDKEYLEEVDDE